MESLGYWPNGPQQVRYWTAYRFVFGSPKAWTNLLLGGVCMLIPVAGPMVLVGYLIGVLAFTLPDERSGYPDFDFGRFVEYLTAGIWPFLVSLIATVAVIIPIYVVFGIGVFAVIAAKPTGPLLGVLIALGVVLFVVAWIGMLLVIEPVLIRAALLREFNGVFDFPWIKDFLRRTWRESLLSMLFLLSTSIPLVIVGYALCLVGIYPALALATFARWHLTFQVYRIYLARGGTPVPTKPLAPPSPRPFAGPPPLPG